MNLPFNICFSYMSTVGENEAGYSLIIGAPLWEIVGENENTYMAIFSDCRPECARTLARDSRETGLS
jgi:hypothetical protein